MSNPRQFPPKRPGGPPPGLVIRAEELRANLRHLPADLLAARTGSTYTELGQGRGEFRLFLFNAPILGSYPNLVFYSAAGNELPNFTQALLLYYFSTAAQNAGQAADGSPLTGKFVSFADLPGGRMYNQAFQGYSGNELVKVCGLDIEAFKTACVAAGGEPASVGETAFRFQALPCVPLLLTYWLGDEDFPSSCMVLFDASAIHYLPIDGCAILGSSLVQKVIKNFPVTKA
jgi:hypothetical protein